MKKIMLFFLIALSTFGLISCKKDTSGDEINNGENDVIENIIDFNKTFKVLSIGNSFSEDSQRYLWEIANSYGIPSEEIVVANMFIGGASLGRHVVNLRMDNPEYIYQKFTSPFKQDSHGVSLETVIMDEDWDVITFQQASHDSGIADEYKDYLNTLTNWAKEKQPNALLGWHMTWAYESTSGHSGFVNYDNDQSKMYNKIVEATNLKVLTNDDIDFIIPAGTTIQNARTSFIGDKLTRDGYHLSDPVGRFMGSLTYFAEITGFDINADTIKFAPFGLAEEFVEVAFESTINAVKNKFRITNSKLLTPPAEEEVIIEGELLDFDYQIGYWNTGSNLVDENSSMSNFKNFIAVMPIAVDDFAAGSYITIEEGYAFRIIRLKKENDKFIVVSRTDNFTDSVKLLDHTLLGNAEYIAFNISSTGGKDLTSVVDETASMLKLYATDTPMLPSGRIVLEQGQWDSNIRNPRVAFVEQWIIKHSISPNELKLLVERAMEKAMSQAIVDGVIPADFNWGSFDNFSEWEGILKQEYRDGDHTANIFGRKHAMLVISESSLKDDGTVAAFIMINDLFVSWNTAGGTLGGFEVVGVPISKPISIDGILYQNFSKGYINDSGDFVEGKIILNDGTIIDLS